MTIEDTNPNPADNDGAGGGIDIGHEAGDGVLQDGQASPPTDEQAVHAFKSGAAEVSNPDLVKPPEPLESETDRSAADVVAKAKPAATAAAPAGSPAPAPAPVTTAVDAAKDAQAAKAAFDKKVQDEIEDLRLKPGSRAAVRFQEMANTNREYEAVKPVLSTLDKAGVKDVATAEVMLDAAARGVQWEDAIHQSTASKEQFGGAMTVIRCMNSGDPKMLNVAFDTMYQQLQDLAKTLGRELPGAVDPLEQFPDLKAAVEAGDITPAFAAKQAQLLASTRMNDQHAQQTAQQQNEQARQQQEQAQGLAAVNAYSTQMQVSDPQFAAKLQAIAPALAQMRTTVHPSNWASFAKTLYENAVVPVAGAAPAPAPAPAPAKPRVTGIQPRQNTVPRVNLNREPVDDVNLFKSGVESLEQTT